MTGLFLLGGGQGHALDQRHLDLVRHRNGPDQRGTITAHLLRHGNQWRGIARLQEASGGFGGLLLRAEDWAPRDKLHRSDALMARYVMPQFQGSLTGLVASNQRSASMKEALQANRRAGLRRATESYLAGR